MRTPRRRPSVLLALVAAVVLVLGSVGTASAGPAITKKAVKKIATKVAAKVVRERAAGLAVASAGDAARLGGQPPSAYLNDTRRVLLPANEASSVKNFVLGEVPAGSYLASYQVVLGSVLPTSCWLITAPIGPHEVLGSGSTAITGSGVVVLDGAYVPRLVCEADAGGDFFLQPGYPSSVVLTRVGPLTTTTAREGLST